MMHMELGCCCPLDSQDGRPQMARLRGHKGPDDPKKAAYGLGHKGSVGPDTPPEGH